MRMTLREVMMYRANGLVSADEALPCLYKSNICMDPCGRNGGHV